MRNKKFLALGLVFLLSMVCTETVRAEEKKIGLTLDLTYTSKWMSKGSAAYGQQGGIFETADVSFWDSGFGIKVCHRSCTSSGYVDKQRFDYRPYFKGIMFEDSPLLTKYNISCGYEHYYGSSLKDSNTTLEWVLKMNWPKLLCNGIVPYYIVHYETPASSGNARNAEAGWIHRFGMNYDLNVAKLPKPISLCSEIAYNDGHGRKTRDHDWSHVTLGASTSFKLSENMCFVPGLYHQITMDKSVNGQKDVTYCMLSMRYKF